MMSVNSSLPESEWDRRLDTMLADLETGSNNNNINGIMQSNNINPVGLHQQFSSQQQQQSYSFSTSSSSTQQMSSSSTRNGEQVQHQQQQARSYKSSHQATAPTPKYGGGFSLTKSPSTGSLKESAGTVLRDLEDGLVKSSNYIQESHGRVVGPEGEREWHEVKRGGDPPSAFNGDEDSPSVFNLEQQVQHMIPGINSNSNTITTNNNNSYTKQQQLYQQQQQQQQQQFTTYKVQSNQYGGTAPDRVQDEDEDRPGSRLKQNIDELDTLLYDLNHARNLSPDVTGPDYTVSSDNCGLDSDDYSETVGKEGHVKRTVSAFNEYSTHMSVADAAKKPPSPSPRRKGPSSPPTPRRTHPHNQTKTNMSQSYHVQETTSTNIHNQSTNQSTNLYPGQQPTILHPGHQHYQPAPGPPGSGQPFAYTPEPPSTSPDLTQPTYFTKYNSVKQTNRTQEVGPSVPFPHQNVHSPTPQNPPKRIDELMSEFQEYDSGSKGGSPTPAMFFKPSNSKVVVTELPDQPPSSAVRLDPTPVVREPSPPPKHIQVSPKGPGVYYPPGAEFSRVEPAPRPVADGGSMSLVDGGKDRAKGGRARYERGEDESNRQGAAVIPICFPLCCAGPCVIL